MITQAYDVFVYGAELVKELRKILKHLPDIDYDDRWEGRIICSENGKIDSIEFSPDESCHIKIKCNYIEMRLFTEYTSRVLYKYNGWDDIYEYKIQNTPYTPINPFDIKDYKMPNIIIDPTKPFDIKDNIQDITDTAPKITVNLDEIGEIKTSNG